MDNSQEPIIDPPKQAYLYFPSEQQIRIKVGKQLIRVMFNGHLELYKEELDQLAIFKEKLVKRKYDLTQIQHWTAGDIFKFLQANQFKGDQTFKFIQEYNTWTKTLPIPFDQEIDQYLNSGIIYIQGRDYQFRPIIVLNAYKINVKQLNQQQQLRGLTYLLEIVLNQMLLPGQVENWVIIMDLNQQGVSDLPLSVLKQVLSYLQNNYRCRLYRMYIVNAPGSLTMTWSMLKPFLDDQTVNKISFLKESKIPEILTHANKAQIEEKYGGTAQNKGTILPYWPPKIDNENLGLENETITLVSEEEYKAMQESGKLKFNKVPA